MINRPSLSGDPAAGRPLFRYLVPSSSEDSAWLVSPIGALFSWDESQEKTWLSSRRWNQFHFWKGGVEKKIPRAHARPSSSKEAVRSDYLRSLLMASTWYTWKTSWPIYMHRNF